MDNKSPLRSDESVNELERKVNSNACALNARQLNYLEALKDCLEVVELFSVDEITRNR
jgi:hypothetical protein